MSDVSRPTLVVVHETVAYKHRRQTPLVTNSAIEHVRLVFSKVNQELAMAKCLEDFRNLFGAGSQPKLCYKPDADEKPVKEDHEISETATNLLPSIMLYGFLILCVCFGLLTYFSGKYRQKLSDSSRLVRRYIGWVLASLLSNIQFVEDYYGAGSKQKLYFVPDANKPDVGHEISEPALFRFLLNEETLKEFKGVEAEIPEMLKVLKDVNKVSKITEFETHQSSIGSIAKDLSKAFHVFIVFKSTSETEGDYWWSLEKHRDYIVLQRSRNKENVKNQCYDVPRIEVNPIVKNLKGKGTIKDLFAVLWAQQMIEEKYHIWKSNCQSFVTCISQQITEIEYEYEGVFPYSPPPDSGRDKKMLDLILILRVCSDWPPLFTLIPMGNVDLVDKMIKSGNYDINACNNELTPLHFAILLEKTKMVKHLLKPPMNADPTKRDASGMNALQCAAMYAVKTEIFDLLLEHDKVNVDDVDRYGETALHCAAKKSNVTAVKKLLEKRANPNIFNKNKMSPLHIAAMQRDVNPIIDLLLAHPKVKVDDMNKDGKTALHLAVSVSNVVAVQKLLENGANPNITDNWGDSPLHVAAERRDGNPIIDLLLEAQKVKGMGDVNDINKEGRTALHCAAYESNEITAEHLVKKGADVNHRDNYGRTPLDMAALGAKNMNIIILLLQNINEGDIQHQYRNNERLFFFAKYNLYGLGNKIGDRFLKKGIEPTSTDTDKCSLEIDEILKEEEFDFNGRYQDAGQTLFNAAISNNEVNLVRLFLERGADPTRRIEFAGFTTFHVAVIMHSDPDTLNLLLESGKVDINETSKRGWTAFHLAIINKSNVTAVRFLLEIGADPNSANEDGLTPLHVAASRAKDMDIVELLVNHPDVDVNCLDMEGNNALDYAMTNKHGLDETIANLLKEKGVVDTENTKQHNMRVLINRISDEIENILSDATVPTGDQISRIVENEDYVVSAIQNSNAETLDVILETGKFDINGTDNRGNTHLHHAIAGTNCDINARHLIGKGADPTIANKEGDTPLHLAAKNAKKIETISLLLENKQVDINHRDKCGRTALHCAIMAENVETVRYLLKEGADPTIRDKDGTTPFHLAALYPTETDPQFLSLMLENEKKIEIDGRNKMGLTALHMAMTTSNVTAARLLLSKGANPNVADQLGSTPLNLAVLSAKNMDIVELLVNHPDVDVNYYDKLGAQAIFYAVTIQHGLSEEIGNLLMEKMASKAERSNPETKTIATLVDSFKENIRYLLEKGQDTTTTKGAITEGENGANALHVAAADEETTDLIDAILETRKFDINGVDSDGRTPLHHAISGTNREINARHLLEKGADPTIRNNKGDTPFHLAAQFLTDTHVLGLMLGNEIKIDIDEKNNDGETALHLAIDKSNVTAVRLLLSNGANPNVADKDGDTPLHWAAHYAKDMDIVDLLLNHPDVDVNCLDKWGINALQWATFNAHGFGKAIGNLLREKMASVMKFRDLDLD
jgi:ankyrin repeat protein